MLLRRFCNRSPRDRPRPAWQREYLPKQYIYISLAELNAVLIRFGEPRNLAKFTPMRLLDGNQRARRRLISRYGNERVR